MVSGQKGFLVFLLEFTLISLFAMIKFRLMMVFTFVFVLFVGRLSNDIFSAFGQENDDNGQEMIQIKDESVIRNLKSVEHKRKTRFKKEKLQEINEMDIVPKTLIDLKHFKNLKKLKVNIKHIDDYKEFRHLKGVKKLKIIGQREVPTKFFTELLKVSSLEAITIKDLNLSKINQVTINDMKNIRHLELFQNEISDLNFLKHFPNLKHIRIDSNKISSIKILSELSKLRFVDLTGNNIKSIEPLRKLKNLRSLHLAENPISSLDTITEIRSLKRLSLGQNKLKTLPDMSSMDKLTYIVLAKEAVRDVSNLFTLKNLRILIMNVSEIKNKTFWKNLLRMKSLQLLSISGEQKEISKMKNKAQDFIEKLQKREVHVRIHSY